MKIIGLTGGIGSGKTYVALLFNKLGVPIYNTDNEAKKIMHLNLKVKNAIIKIFGAKAYLQGNLNRKLISKKVFNDKELLNKLNAIVHPVVAVHFEDWCLKQEFDFVIKESAILFETGGYKKCHWTILITAPIELRIQRIISRDNLTKAEINKRINNQWPDEKKQLLANFVIQNIEKGNTKNKVEKLLEFLKKEF